MKISIVGHGFVGQAVEYGFKTIGVQIQLIDPKYGTELDEIDDFGPDLTFVCVPTPMGHDGSIDATILQRVTRDLLGMHSGIIVIKSTVTPDVITKISLNRFSNFVYSPEFLTERNAANDFANPSFHIFGGEREVCEKVHEYYKRYSICSPAPVHYTTLQEASMIKYAVNSFLATKVAWFNQLKDLCDKNGFGYNVIANAVGSDPRIGHSHTKVPGPDGKRGFGGSCFPKDTAAFKMYSLNSGSLLSILSHAIAINHDYRSGYDLDDREIEQNVRYIKG